MKYEQWEEILWAINDETDLSKDNVIEKIKQKLELGNKDEYEKWREADLDVNHRFEEEDMGRFTLLHLATRHEAASVVNALLGVEEIDVNAVVGRLEWTPLHEAAASICKETIDALLKSKKINVNAVDKDGRTHLHWAAYYNCKKIARSFIANGADPSSKDNEGQTPRDLAGYDDVKEFLKEAEEKQLREQNEGTSNLPQNNTDKDNNKDTTRLLGKTEPTSATKKGVFASGATAVLGTATAVALFATGVVAVELIPIVIAVAATATAALAVGGITYMLSKPSTEMDEVQEEQCLINQRI
ncbi:ankyrin repeat domain-containing protein [Candidatus Wolbachia massiliensis]|uniref:Ankyrin repeat domain-containing protein n=1 Tax=Candidatus Wolbachia massiliensis TaxID=1845000 RepID=A0A7L7YMB2_9RICK|nr:ankyrin repeat domain-containing protein [Candidatus Wolbachia massiliensis]QOD38382.1 ankyrin repeat domain-containing protein [Candidatus Wolbachia massiliensis]